MDMLKQILLVALLFVLCFAFGKPLAGDFTGLLAIFAGLALAAGLLWRSGEGLAALGLTAPGRWRWLLPKAVGIALLGLIAAGIAATLSTQLIGWPPLRTDRFAELHGNLPLLIFWLGISWSSAAFGEEMLFRGFLQSRLLALFAGWRGGRAAAVLIQAGLFSLGHAYQGPTGLMTSASIGLLFGALALRSRSLWPLIIAHGLIDTLSMLVFYFGLPPR